MLLKRILSAIVLLILAALIFSVGGYYLLLFSVLLHALFNYEFFTFSLKLSLIWRLQFTAACSLIPLGYLYNNFEGFFAGLWICLIFFFTLFVFYTEGRPNFPNINQLIPATFLGVCYTGILGSGVVIFASEEAYRIPLVWLLGVVVLTDSAAYFGGKLFGKRSFAPRISPRKTIAGACSGLLAGTIFGYSWGLSLGVLNGSWPLFAYSFLACVLAQLGDLTESLLKRTYEVKDSGELIPGHGGVLDRLDGFIFALPILFFF